VIRTAAQILEDIAAHDAGLSTPTSLRTLAERWERERALERREVRNRRRAEERAAARARLLAQLDALIYRCPTCSQWRMHSGVAITPHVCDRCDATQPTSGTRPGARCRLVAGHVGRHAGGTFRRHDRPGTYRRTWANDDDFATTTTTAWSAA
jgi:hypothetical protein